MFKLALVHLLWDLIKLLKYLKKMELYQKKPEICLSENTKLLEIGLEVRNQA